MIKNVKPLAIICFFSVVTVAGQENSSWYSYSLGGGKTKITELKEFIVYEQVQEEESPYPARIDSVAIVKRLNDSTYIVSETTRKGGFAIMANSWLQNGTIRSTGIYYPSETIEATESMYSKQEGLPDWSELTMRWLFSEEKSAVLEEAPGYDEVTREAILEALSVRKEISPALKAYAKDHPDTKPFQLYRFAEVKAQHRFIELGYNPYKPVAYNFKKQFEGDEEVIKLLTEPVSFD